VTDQRPDAAALEDRVGHPGERWQVLRDRVQDNAITKFADIQAEWLALMWSIDAFRTAGIAPRLMGREDIDDALRLAAVYRFKGNWFATLISLLLQNQTHQQISPRTKVKGFSQNHQIDVAWPVREEDPLVCVETKVSGAPATKSVSARGALSDFSNRRKELKFAATDLKLNRRQQDTAIEHWGVWRENAPPKTYFLWAARLRTTGRNPEVLSRLIVEASALRDSYLDGAGLIAWRERDDGSGYEGLTLPTNARVTELDDTIYRIASQINRLTGPGGKPPEPVTPAHRVVDVERLADDTADEAPR
jgi:hypothetical protein